MVNADGVMAVCGCEQRSGPTSHRDRVRLVRAAQANTRTKIRTATWVDQIPDAPTVQTDRAAHAHRLAACTGPQFGSGRMAAMRMNGQRDVVRVVSLLSKSLMSEPRASAEQPLVARSGRCADPLSQSAYALALSANRRTLSLSPPGGRGAGRAV